MKIAFLSSCNSFCMPILKEFRKYHEVCQLKVGETVGLERMSLLLNWADLIYCEWADQLLQMATWLRPDKPIVARLHRYELYSSMLTQIRWKNVDTLIFNVSSDHTLHKFQQRIDHDELPRQMLVMPDGVDVELFKFIERDFKEPYQMCIVGNVIPRKGVYELIRMFYDLDKDNWILNIVGKFYEEYYENCRELVEALGIDDKVRFWKHIEHDKLPKFFKTQHVIVSNSRDEGNHTVIKEGMSTGLYPVINCWLGADKTYPNRYIFKSQKQFIEHINNWEDLSPDEKLDVSKKLSDFVKVTFDVKESARKIREVCEDVFERWYG